MTNFRNNLLQIIISCISIAALSVPSLSAQQATNSKQLSDTSRTLPTAHIAAQSIRQHTIGEQHETWNQATLQRYGSSHLGELLASESGVFVKSYGLGSSATTSVRGGSAGHTAVIWNGLPVDNPMLGQLDFSLMPVALVDEASLSLGGNSASWGSGAIGGTVILGNKPIFDGGHTLEGSAEMGSFGWNNQQLRWQHGTKKWSHGIRFARLAAKNDFEYKSTGGAQKKQSNAAILQSSILHEAYWKVRPNQLLSIHTWLQQTDREIPPTTVQNKSIAEQTDEFWRTSLSWKQTANNGVTAIKAGLFRELQNYRDDQILLNADNNFWKATGEVTREWHFNKNQQLQVGANHVWLEAKAGAYNGPMSQNRSAAFAIYRHHFGKTSSQLNIRQEVVDGGLVPIVPALGVEIAALEWLTIRSKITRNYRLPTLNDLFWQPGGNAALLAERGWSEEIGLEAKLLPESWNATYGISAFNRNIDNWIQWGIRDGENFYSANNISKVWSRGIEQRVALDFHFSKLEMAFKGGYDFIKSTYQEAIENPKVEVGQQLLYVPKHQAFGGIQCNWKNFQLNYQHQFTGKVATQNAARMPSYHVGTARLSFDWKADRVGGQVFFKTENLWNANYRVIERRAMPGRHFRFGASFKIG